MPAVVSRHGHCLNDLLFRTRSGDLPLDVVAVVSNHPDHEALVSWHGIPFFHVPVTAANKPPKAEAQLLEIVDFLPSFKGAKPYLQAHDRGVKLVGATAHYVTADLDEGPIIAQEVPHAAVAL